MLHPEMIPAILKTGRHEIGVHGWIHEFLPRLGSAAEEERLLNQAIDYLTKATGKRPVGYRAPAWAFSEHTIGLIRKSRLPLRQQPEAMDEPYELLSTASHRDHRAGDRLDLTETPYLGRTGAMPSSEQLYQLYGRSSTARTSSGRCSS